MYMTRCVKLQLCLPLWQLADIGPGLLTNRRALVQERLTTASYMDKLGAVQGEMTAQQQTIKTLQDEKARLKGEVETAKTSANAMSTDKARLRLERQVPECKG
ncbi:hypothetical protein AUP68_00964 [Ilyonectria robusta]